MYESFQKGGMVIMFAVLTKLSLKCQQKKMLPCYSFKVLLLAIKFNNTK